MKIAIACDHRGFAGKTRLLPSLRQMGHEVRDFGCDGSQSVDYPDFAYEVSCVVADGSFDAGILLDGSGIGMAMVANKIAGVRAAPAADEVMARRARENNHCNVLCLPTDLLGEEMIRRIVEVFLTTEFIVGGRHARRVEKIRQIEQRVKEPQSRKVQ